MKKITNRDGFKFDKELPRAFFSRPDIPFRCEIQRHRWGFPPIVICNFEDYLPAYGKDLDKLSRHEFDTIQLFFPNEANHLMPPHKIASKDEYKPFSVHDRDSLYTDFITRFQYITDYISLKSRIKVSPIYQKMFEKYPEDKIEESYLLDDAKYRVRKIVADNPVVRINDKNEIIDGPF